MMCKAKVAVCSEIRRKHLPQSKQASKQASKHHAEFFNVKPSGMKRSR
jgi:mannose/fructose/N-acetylgalactosamine-specific phosphotransferase system component IID